MNRVAADLEQRTNGNGELARKRINGVSHVGQESEQPDSDDPMRATAESLIRIATKAFMQMNNVDHETAQRWIAGAAVAAAKNGKPAPKSGKARKRTRNRASQNSPRTPA